MAILDILHFPDPRLRLKAKPVPMVDKNIRQIVDDMFETMYAANGIGLAATQVNIQKQIIVMDLSEERDQPLCLINPKIIKSTGKRTFEEGCLSVPGFHENVERADLVTVEALDRDGELRTWDAADVFATCIQHEMDHLDGKVFVDHISSLKRQRIRKKLEKQFRQAS